MPDSIPPDFFHTYTLLPVEAELEQGDILAKTPDLLEILKVVHPEYSKDDYTHFLVVTQSCDLVRRKKGSCKSKYISLAAIRPLIYVVAREIEDYQGPFERAGMVCSTEHRYKVKQFLERVFNYNEPEYFYLHPETRANFPNPSCAFLQLSVAFQVDHYKTCQEARILSLAPLYQAKLGWMVGHMFSRVGTDDWVPKAESKEEFDKKLKELLDKYYHWIDPKQLQQAKKTQPPDLLAAGQEMVLNHIQRTVVQDLTQEVITAVVAILKKPEIATAEDQVEKIRVRLNNDGVLAKLRRLPPWPSQE